MNPLKTGNPSLNNFQWFLFTRVFFTLALNMLGTLVAWFIYQVSHNPLDLGFTGLAEIIPYVGLLLFGGAWADRFNRKKLMGIALLAYVLISLGIWFIAMKASQGFPISLLSVYGLLFLTGLSRGILSPAQNALMGQLVPKERLQNASVWNSAVFHLGAVLGPAAGGLMYAYFGAGFSFGVVTGLMAISFFLLLMIRNIANPEFKDQGEPILSRIKTGLTFVTSHKILLPGMMMDMVAVLFGGAVAVLPLFADQILHTGAEGLGWLRASPSIGSLVMSGILIRFPLGKGAGKWLLVCVFALGLTNFIFAISESWLLSFSMLFLGGLFDNVSAVIRMSIVQIFTPDEMRGRVSAVNAIFIGSSNELGAFESGVAARFMGLVSSVTFGAYVTFATVAITAWKAPELRNLNMKAR
jgi:MFS family permease